MSQSNKILTLSLIGLLLGASITNISADTQRKPDIRVNIQDNGEFNSSGFQTNSVSANTDRQILDQVKSLIGNNYERYNINIHVSEGTVLLRGVIDSDANLTQIEKDIRNIKGVKDVQNQLHVEESKK